MEEVVIVVMVVMMEVEVVFELLKVAAHLMVLSLWAMVMTLLPTMILSRATFTWGGEEEEGRRRRGGEEERKRGGEEEEGRRRKGKEEMWLPHALPRRLARTWPRPATGAQAGG